MPVSSQLASPSLEGAPNPLLQHVFFPSVTAAVRKALMSTLLPRSYWHLKSPKHHFCISNHPSIVCRVSWQTDDVLKTVVLLHSLKHVHTARNPLCGPSSTLLEKIRPKAVLQPLSILKWEKLTASLSKRDCTAFSRVVFMLPP